MFALRIGFAVIKALIYVAVASPIAFVVGGFIGVWHILEGMQLGLRGACPKTGTLPERKVVSGAAGENVPAKVALPKRARIGKSYNGVVAPLASALQRSPNTKSTQTI